MNRVQECVCGRERGDREGTNRVVVCHFQYQCSLCCSVFYAVSGLLDNAMQIGETIV